MSALRGVAPPPAYSVIPGRLPVTLPFDERVRRGVAFARSLAGQVELPGRPNRGWLPDLVNAHFGSPLGSSWCANTAGYVRWWARLPVPDACVGDCDVWRDWAEDRGLWESAAGHPARLIASAPPLSVVLYTGWVRRGRGRFPDRYDAVHAGLTLPLDGGHRPLVFEGNTSGGVGLDVNGGGAFVKEPAFARLYGIVRPSPA